MTKNTLWTGIFMASLSITTLGRAEQVEPPASRPTPAPAHGLELEGRASYAVPMGQGMIYDTWVDNAITSQTPIGFGIGYRFNQHLSVGADFQYGSMQRNDQSQCMAAGESCSARDMRTGIDVRYHFLPEQSLSPWVSLGVGYEWLTLSQYAPAAWSQRNITFKGVEIANLQFGADFNVASNFLVGPFIGASLGEFSSVNNTFFDPAISYDVGLEDKTLHGWFAIGVRGAYDIAL